MTHFGIVAPAADGHSRPMAALGRELIARGHRCTFFAVQDWEKKVLAEGLEFAAIGREEYPPGSWPEVLIRLGRTDGLENFNFTIATYRSEAQILCREVPALAKSLGVEALLVDQSEPAGATVADRLGLPYITVCCALMLNQEDTVPPPVFGWRHEGGVWARLRNRLGYALLNRISGSIWKVLVDARNEWGLPPQAGYNDTCSKLAQISQQPRDFEYPRRELPDSFHFCGPLRSPMGPQATDFPWERLDGRPLVFGSLGTLQNRKPRLLRLMASACADLDVQLVLAHLGAVDEEEASALPGRPIAVRWAPQMQILSKASLCITHCGLNTVLESLSFAVPMVGLPVAHDQPGTASRIDWTGTGVVLEHRKLNESGLRLAVQRVLGDPNFARAAISLRQSILEAGGVARAGDVCELAARTCKPVVSPPC
ncbi:glycosyltransferase [Gloeobacter morelensis]|uniref:glycosyltransferase n=1 Tax=Gloeobacter morelensis TaxID=2907343 RepID=UPI001E37FED4|nr:nucleotide disphospho-sugar-binding domain-containing protein [Gloeobacter morelensis]UFP97154.1 glycosyl transferase family 1 [Gloeobacter morelensis MG652769]